MKRLMGSFVLGMAVVCFSSTAYAQPTVVDFDQYRNLIGENNAWAPADLHANGVGEPSTTSGIKWYYGMIDIPYTETRVTYEDNSVTFRGTFGTEDWSDWFGGQTPYWSGTALSTMTTADTAACCSKRLISSTVMARRFFL